MLYAAGYYPTIPFMQIVKQIYLPFLVFFVSLSIRQNSKTPVPSHKQIS